MSECYEVALTIFENVPESKNIKTIDEAFEFVSLRMPGESIQIICNISECLFYLINQ